MNGEVSQACRIVAAARKAMKNGTGLEFTPMKYEGRVSFNFCDRSGNNGISLHANNPADWYEHLKKEGAANIFLVTGLKVSRPQLGYVNHAGTTIFVRYSDNAVTRFVPSWTFSNETSLWTTVYTEYTTQGAPDKDPEYRNESALMTAALTDIEALAEEIGADKFVKTFKRAREILAGGELPALKEGANPPSIPEDRMRAYMAADIADVFGAMGSWNDIGAAAAQEKGRSRDYSDLSDRLLYSMRLMIMYAVNFPID